MGKELKTKHESKDHDLVNSADEVQIGTTAHDDRTQPAGHSLEPTRTRTTGSNEDDPKNHRTK
ncbi:hypothetical protein [Stutzerimonas azotifigens]|uniref:hypothetical protein n=1 Tax=Stutzerimonas azotifigens TaxID=291995 RepID=UPI00042169A2|nr:hypothetical protein [Stutzerimonas azotifigens]